ncbi:MAG: 2OG-Fe(II) oxygenase [Kiloniellales bacterium]|nr:2OG-Fe(II) oxygenase [Kiloniellales bacterium]
MAPSQGSQVRSDAPAGVEQRLARRSWGAAEEDLDERGYTVLERLLTPDECRGLGGLFACDEGFRSTVVMARHAYGEGVYRYFDYPLPPLVQGLRQGIYRRLAALANTWSERLRLNLSYPAELADYLADCHAAGQTRATPLLLRYEPEGHNCLHQDRYGALAFPFQAAVLLSAPGIDFSGGEFLLVEQRARRQSRAEVVPLQQGDAVIFAGQLRPVASARGFSRAQLRHGVSRVTEGQRTTLGVIFHDAQ